MQLENVIMDFPFFLIWKYAEHSVWGGCSAVAHRKLPDGNNQSHKNGILISFLPEREKEKETSKAKFRTQTNSPAAVSSSEMQRWRRWEPDYESRWDTAVERGVGWRGTLQQLRFSTPKFLIPWPKINLLPVPPLVCWSQLHNVTAGQNWALTG